VGRAQRVEQACRRALEAEAVNVNLIGRMLERGTEQATIQSALPGIVITGRFARDPAHFAVRTSKRPHPDNPAASLRPSGAIVEAGSGTDLAGGAR
jgi:hypothetical protein